jgi:hypothetical protein
MKPFKQLFTEVVVFSDIKKGNKLGYSKLLGKDKTNLLFNLQKQKQVFKPFGKIGTAEVYQHVEAGATPSFDYIVFEDGKSTLYLRTKKYGKVSQQVESTVGSNNKTKAKDLYAFIVRSGIDLVSDVMQSEGGKAIWRSLSKERGISIVGWDGERLHNLGSRLDDYTDDDTYDRPGAEFEDEEEVKTRRKMVLVAMKK